MEPRKAFASSTAVWLASYAITSLLAANRLLQNFMPTLAHSPHPYHSLCIPPPRHGNFRRMIPSLRWSESRSWTMSSSTCAFSDQAPTTGRLCCRYRQVARLAKAYDGYVPLLLLSSLRALGQPCLPSD